MRLFGEYAGIAFQIKDDLFDYTQTTLIGKPTGLDIREKKMTLPLIHVLNKAQKKDKDFIINTIKNDSKNQEKIEKILDIVSDGGGLEYGEKKMMMYYTKAIKILNTLDKNEAVKSLGMLMDYVVNRKK